MMNNDITVDGINGEKTADTPRGTELPLVPCETEQTADQNIPDITTTKTLSLRSKTEQTHPAKEVAYRHGDFIYKQAYAFN